MKIEVIMSAYNNVCDLQLVLNGYRCQSEPNFSICIADDGSGPEVRHLVEEYSDLNIRHVWQEDRGFRRACIINKAIATSQAEHIILTDGDCIPSPDFVADHKDMASPDKFTVGVRVYIKQDISQRLRNQTLDITALFNVSWMLWQSIKKKISKLEQAIKYPTCLLPLVAKFKPRMNRFGSNLAMSRQSLCEVNGLDEDYEGWGFEDVDLLWRLSVHGLTPTGSLGRCRQYHLDHKLADKNTDARAHFMRKQQAGKIRCLNGIEKLTDTN